MSKSIQEDVTPIKINGIEVDSQIKNPINMNSGIQSNYKDKTIPKRIRKERIVIDLNKATDTAASTLATKTYIKSARSNSKERLNKNDIDIQQHIVSNILELNTPELTNKVLESKVPESKVLEVKVQEEKIPKNDSTEQQLLKNEMTNDEVQEIEVPEVKVPESKESSSPLIELSKIKSNKPKRVKRIVRRIRRKKNNINSNESGIPIPDYNRMSAEEQILYRNSFKLKFDSLRKIHQGLNIEKGIEDHPNLHVVHQLYELYLTQVYTDLNSNFYRGILLISWLGLELFGTYVLGLNVTGYAKQQIELLWAYEPIINKMSKVEFGQYFESWSPFQKLIGLTIGTFIFMIIINLILSYISKYTGMQLTGFSSTITNLISGLVTSKPQASNMPPIIINNSNIPNNLGSVNLGGLHNIPIPESSTLNSNTQLNMANGIINVINKFGNNLNNNQQTNNPQAVNQQAVNPQVINPVKRVIPRPSFDS